MKDQDTMASKRGSEASLTVGILKEIRDAARETNTRVHALQKEMRRGFTRLEARIDNLHRQEHEKLRGRVERIEQHLGLESR